MNSELFARWLKHEPGLEWRCECGGTIDVTVIDIPGECYQVSSARCRACGCKPSPHGGTGHFVKGNH
jgi:hypothetical protein